MSKPLPGHTKTSTLSRNAKIFAALGDETRLQLLMKLSAGCPLSIKQLTTDLPLTRQAVTKHLRVLEQANFVTKKTQGRESQFRAQKTTIEEAQSVLNSIAQQWDDALLRLKNFAENT